MSSGTYSAACHLNSIQRKDGAGLQHAVAQQEQHVLNVLPDVVDTHCRALSRQCVLDASATAPYIMYSASRSAIYYIAQGCTRPTLHECSAIHYIRER